MKYSEFLKALSQAYTAFVDEGGGTKDQAYICLVLGTSDAPSEYWIQDQFSRLSGESVSVYRDHRLSLENEIEKVQTYHSKSFETIISKEFKCHFECEDYYYAVNLARAKWLMGLALQEEALGN